MTPNDIVAAARSAIGTPFRHQGRMSASVSDCVGLAAHICDQIGIPYVDRSGYSRGPFNGLLEAALDEQEFIEPVSDGPLPGDLLLIRIKRNPQHVAIFAGHNPACEAETMIHADASVGKVCEHIYTDRWKARTVRIYRFRGLT